MKQCIPVTDLGHNLKIGITEFSDGLDIKYERKWDSRMISKISASLIHFCLKILEMNDSKRLHTHLHIYSKYVLKATYHLSSFPVISCLY